eukprot:15479533-Alexandrium_andersonii.AAC.1
MQGGWLPFGRLGNGQAADVPPYPELSLSSQHPCMRGARTSGPPSLRMCIRPGGTRSPRSRSTGSGTRTPR